MLVQRCWLHAHSVHPMNYLRTTVFFPQWFTECHLAWFETTLEFAFGPILTCRNASKTAVAVKAAAAAFHFAHHHQHIIALHCTHSPWYFYYGTVTFPLPFITQFGGVDANERAFQHKHTRTHSHSTNSFYIFRESHMIFPLVVGFCFSAMLVRHSCIYSPYFICAAILCLYMRLTP